MSASPTDAISISLVSCSWSSSHGGSCFVRFAKMQLKLIFFPHGNDNPPDFGRMFADGKVHALSTRPSAPIVSRELNHPAEVGRGLATPDLGIGTVSIGPKAMTVPVSAVMGFICTLINQTELTGLGGGPNFRYRAWP